MFSIERLDAFVDQTCSCLDIAALKAVVSREIRALGFDLFAYVALRRPNNLPSRLYFGTHPVDWAAYYLEKSLWLHDPVMHHPFQSVMPFLWNEPDQANGKAAKTLVFGPAADAGLGAGAAVPIHGPAGGVALLSVSKECLPETLAILFAEQRHMLQIVAYATHDAVVRLAATMPVPTMELSPRQKEVLLWTIEGKTNWEIGEILKISEDTVRQHLRVICRQLGAANRTQAVAIAVNRKMLSPDGRTDRTIYLA